MGTIVSKIFLSLRLINCLILLLLLIKELSYDLLIFLFSVLDTNSAIFIGLIGIFTFFFLVGTRLFALLLLFIYRIKTLYFPRPKSQDFPIFKASFFTHRIVQAYPRPALRYYLIIIFNTICIAYFFKIFDFSGGPPSLEFGSFVALLLSPFTLLATFYDTQFVWRNTFYAFILNILYLIGGLFLAVYIYSPSFRALIPI